MRPLSTLLAEDNRPLFNSELESNPPPVFRSDKYELENISPASSSAMKRDPAPIGGLRAKEVSDWVLPALARPGVLAALAV